MRQLRIDPSSTKVLVGRAHLSVDPLTRSGSGLSGTYKLEVSPVPIGNESGKLSVDVSGDDLRRLAQGETVQFSGQAVSAQGNRSEVRGTATPKGNGEGALQKGQTGVRHLLPSGPLNRTTAPGWENNTAMRNFP